MTTTMKIACDCGYEAKGAEPRAIEADMWVHAIRDHLDMVKSMSAEQLTGLMKGWDGEFARQR